jgi:CheY-like chemotaxis protein
MNKTSLAFCTKEFASQDLLVIRSRDVMKKLLVVDENTTIQRVIKLAFKDEAIRVITVPRGKDVFEQIEADLPDIVLADNGSEVAAFLKSRPTLSHIPVVLLKGAFDPAGEGPDEAQGCDDVLMKPLQPQAMIDRVKRLLRTKKAGARKAPAPPQPAATVAPLDSNLALGQYFDQLSVAFSRAEHSTPLPAEGWLSGSAWGFSATAAPTKRDIQARPPLPVPSSNVQPAVARPASTGVTDDLVEKVTQRVLDRLGDRMVRGTATELVARLSKWLILDEVERTKAGK